jgi:hypothetical protein
VIRNEKRGGQARVPGSTKPKLTLSLRSREIPSHRFIRSITLGSLKGQHKSSAHPVWKVVWDRRNSFHSQSFHSDFNDRTDKGLRFCRGIKAAIERNEMRPNYDLRGDWHWSPSLLPLKLNISRMSSRSVFSGNI